MCTFQTLSALSTHLSRYHTQERNSSAKEIQELVTFKCPLCTFQQPFSESVLLSHIRTHLKKHETVVYPYKGCNYCTNVYSLIPIKVECIKRVLHQTLVVTLSTSILRISKPPALTSLLIWMKSVQFRAQKCRMMSSVMIQN